jgi:acyl-CoA hydrolase
MTAANPAVYSVSGSQATGTSRISAPRYHSEVETLVDAIIDEVGHKIVLGLPLGIGKANTIANALYARACRDSSIRLHIFTALTLEPPQPASDLERRLMEPIMARLLGGYPALAYAKAQRAGKLPANIEVNEFFLLAGRWLSNRAAQQNYVSANYTHATRYLVERGVNVIAQLVARKPGTQGDRFSLSCNTDTTLDLLDARELGTARFLAVCEVNSELPFMPGRGDLPAATFAHVLDSRATDFPLFAPPKESIGLTEYAIGLHAARLIADGGTLQIGIGEEADATVRALMLRHQDNSAFRSAVERLVPETETLPFEERTPFRKGLYGVSEMFVDGFLELMRAGILTREVEGAVLHAAFFLGPRAFYRALRELSESERNKIQMTAVSFTNELYGAEDAKRAQRSKARFVNNAMMATLMGAIVSDGLEDGRVVSGVGGQYNFVAQAFALPDARSILALHSTRETKAGVQSNIRWHYGHTTIPRHLRDIVVTEYGVADLRGKSDRDVIAAMLAVTDSRFQPLLLKAARDAGKIEKSFELPQAQRRNTPGRIAEALRPLIDAGLLPPYPFGTDLDVTEQNLVAALGPLKHASALLVARTFLKGLFAPHLPEIGQSLERMGLYRPRSMSQWMSRALLLGALTR